MDEENRIKMYAENGFEPLTRTRSNTWPLPRPEGYVDGPLIIDGAATTGNPESIDDPTTQRHFSGQVAGSSSSTKKKLPRRNAWGTQSYAELITQAISSAKDQRLTLAQIYEWMVKNVPYFKAKGASNSSAGWKNSIRHNLSLHDRFIRIPCEGSGKSSWWMINPDAKIGKSTRRRAASMEVGKFEWKRGRARRQAEILRKASPHVERTSSPSSSLGDGIDVFNRGCSPLHRRALQSPAYQVRASSSASSCGRLSPIPATNEAKWTQQKIHNLVTAGLAEQTTMAPVYRINHMPERDQQTSMNLPQTYQNEQLEAFASDLQNIPVAYSSNHQVAAMCPVHQLGVCNCDLNMLPMERPIQVPNTATSYVFYETDQYNNYFDAGHANQYSMMASQTTLMPIQEIADFGSIDLQIENQPMVRNNSVLEDIDEIIRRDQYAAIELVNNSMSTALYISSSNPANPIGQHSWIHS